jgi:hypothetical protein
MDLSGVHYLAIVGLRTFLQLWPYLVFVIVATLWGELRSWGGKRSIIKRINRTAIDEISHQRMKDLEKTNRKLLAELKLAKAESRIYQRRLQSAFMSSDWGQEVIDKILRDRQTDRETKGRTKSGNQEKRVSKNAS